MLTLPKVFVLPLDRYKIIETLLFSLFVLFSDPESIVFLHTGTLHKSIAIKIIRLISNIFVKSKIS